MDGLIEALAGAGRRRAGANAAFVPNAFLRVGTDGSVTVIAKHVEMGQGAYTGIATIVAEELDADWERVRVESAPADAKRYANLAFGTMQGTGGSSAMANSWLQLREAGAKARAVLRGRRRQGVEHRALGARRRQGSGHPRRHAAACDVRILGSRGPFHGRSRQGRAQGPAGFQVDRATCAAGGRSGQVRRHRAIHVGHRIPRHARGVAQACAAVRGDGAGLRRRRPPPRSPGWSRSCKCRAESP